VTVAELIKALEAMPQDVDVVTVFDSFAPSHVRSVERTTYHARFHEVVEDWHDRDDTIVVID
jgi:hypothetical protein